MDKRIIKHQIKKGNCEGFTFLNSSYKNAKVILLCLSNSHTIESEDQINSFVRESEVFNSYNIQCATAKYCYGTS